MRGRIGGVKNLRLREKEKCRPAIFAQGQLVSCPRVITQKVEGFSPSPLMGEGWGGGESAGHGYNLSPSPQPPPTRGGGVIEAIICRVFVGHDPRDECRYISPGQSGSCRLTFGP